MVAFEVHLDVYRGPLDLLLYLVRRQELSIAQLPLSRIAEQYCEYLGTMHALNVNDVAEFIEVATLLVEIKSRIALPQSEQGTEVLWDEPHQQLVQRLLEYKHFRDAASALDERSRQWQLRYPRMAPDLSANWIDPARQAIEQVELWDLVSAFGRILRDSRAVQPSSIVYDETPIQVYIDRILDTLKRHPRVDFSELFSPGMHKSAMIGIFLAILELVRHHCVRTEQPDGEGEIWLYLETNPQSEHDPSDVVP